MTDLSPAYGVPYMNKTRGSKNPMDVMRQIMDAKSDQPDDEILEAFADKIERDRDQTRMCLKAYGVNLMTSIRRLQPEEVLEERRVKREAVKAERQAAAGAIAVHVRSRLAETILTLTFGQVAELAKTSPQQFAQFAKIAKMGKPSQRVDQVLCLADLRKLGF